MRLFGTDGIRAPFGDHPLEESLVIHLGYCLARMLSAHSEEPRVVIGGDSRESTPQISRWLAAGLDSGGARSIYGGVLPTPAVAWTVLDLGAAAGISVSASHNLHPYNGIKLFDGEGFKWSPEAEETLEEMMAASRPVPVGTMPTLHENPKLASGYLEALGRLVGGSEPFAGLRIVLDCANGAATRFAEPLFSGLGADVVALGDRPDGRNINAACGSTAPAAMLAAIEQSGADLGVAFDGDADRALIGDETGRMRDGDAMMFAWARHLKAGGDLTPSAIVATTMSNLGLEKALLGHGIALVRCDVGDRTVVATMRERGIRLGGEQSGHLVDLRASTTGDGLATALFMAKILKSQDLPLSELLADFRRFPQVLLNLEVEQKPPFETLPGVVATARKVEHTLGDRGRLVLRYSGTEPLARVMIEGPELGEIEDLANQLIDAIRDAIGVEDRQSG